MINELLVLLEQVIREVPYNSFSIFIKNLGIDCPSSLGGHCVNQNKALAELLRSNGYSPAFICSYENLVTHYATLCPLNDELFYLDPFIMQRAPIPLSRAMNNGQACTVDAFPRCGERWSKVILKPIDKERFSVELHGLVKNEYILIRKYNFNLSKVIKELPKPNSNSLLTRKKKLSVRFLVNIDEVSTVGINLKTNSLNLKVLGTNKKFLRFDRSPKQFMRDLDRICSDCGLSSDLLINNLLFGYLSYLHYFPD